jgi:hypothetical protein
MTAKHHLTHADQLYYGGAYDPALFAANERKGIRIHPLSKISLGSPAVGDNDNLIIGATSTELPNNGTKTYKAANDNTSPADGAIAAPSNTVMADGSTILVWVLDVPRNIVATSTTAAADTVFTITGYDQYKQPMVESFTITSGASALAGKKAFKYIYSIDIYSAGDITTDTVTVGTGKVLGLPYPISAKSDIMQLWFNSVREEVDANIAVADTATATATTGDVRGTVDLVSSLNGSTVEVWGCFDASGFGVAQFAR